MGDIDTQKVVNQFYGSIFAVTVQFINYLLNVYVSHFKADNI